MDPRYVPGENERVCAPTQAEWDAMSPAERRRVVESLSPSLGENEASPPEGDLHFAAKVSALDALRGFFGGAGRGVYIASELAVYYPGARRFAPDLLVVFDVAPHPRTRWVVSAEGKGLEFVLEVHCGGDRRKDAVQNVAFYASLGIPEYFILDRSRALLRGHRLPQGGGAYVPILPQSGRYPSAALGLDLALEDDRLRFFKANAPILDSTEWVERLGSMLEATQRRAEEEARRAEEEARRRVELEARLAEALAELARLER